MSRVTLFRHVGSREALLSQALWLLTQRTLEVAAARWEAERPAGRAAHAGHRPAHQRDRLPVDRACAGCWMTSQRSRCACSPTRAARSRPGSWPSWRHLLRRDIAEFGLVTLTEPDALAFALVRLGESFLYADVLAARKPDVATANRLQQALIEGIVHIKCRRREMGPRVPPAGRPPGSARVRRCSGAWPAPPPRVASCSASSARASRRPPAAAQQRDASRKKMMPPKQIQYQVFHWPGVWRGRLLHRRAVRLQVGEHRRRHLGQGRQLGRVRRDLAAAAAPTAMTPLMAAWLALIVVSTAMALWRRRPPPRRPGPAAWAGSAAGLG